MSSAFVGMDLGGTNARAAVVEASGRVVSVVKHKVTDSRPEAVARTLTQAVSEAVSTAGRSISGYGVGVPGQVTSDEGHVAVAPNLGWRNVEFGSILSSELGHPVRVVNDLSAAAWGEVQAGAAVGAKDVWVVFVGSGVGSAVVANGRLVLGASGVAGEFGHIKVEAQKGRLCGCGEYGCLEAYVGGHNLIAQMKEKLAEGAPSLLRQESALTAGGLEKAAEAGDALATAIYEKASGLLALAVANQVTMLNPSHVVLGGGVLENCPGLQRRIVDGIQRHAATVSRQKVIVCMAGLGDNSGLVGAAFLGALS